MPLFDLNQLPVIGTNVYDLVSFWYKGVDAAKAFMTAAVGSGLSAIDSFEVFKAQVPLLQLIGGESETLSPIRDYLTPEERFTQSAFRHDTLNKVAPGFTGWVQIVNNRGLLDNWFDFARRTFSLELPLADFMEVLVEQTVVARGQHMMEGIIGIDHSLALQVGDLRNLARSIFENLIENAIKYSKADGGSLEIFLKGNDLVFKDIGVGMDPVFAAGLGGGQQIRECRAEGVGGDGIGWDSIGRNAALLGWTWDIETSPGEGTKVTLHLKPGDIQPFSPPVVESLLGGNGLKAADILEGASVLAGVQPFAGYRYRNGVDLVDISNSPIFQSIDRARILMERFEKNTVR